MSSSSLTTNPQCLLAANAEAPKCADLRPVLARYCCKTPPVSASGNNRIEAATFEKRSCLNGSSCESILRRSGRKIVLQHYPPSFGRATWVRRRSRIDPQETFGLDVFVQLGDQAFDPPARALDHRSVFRTQCECHADTLGDGIEDPEPAVLMFHQPADQIDLVLGWRDPGADFELSRPL